MSLRIQYFGADVRIVYNSWEPTKGDDVIVEQRIKANPKTGAEVWEKYLGYNSMSNDYAYTEAQGTARKLAHKLATNESKEVTK